MFLLRSIDLVALLGLLVQTLAALGFVAIFAALRRRQRELVPFGGFLRAFIALSLALTLLCIRYFREHDVTPQPDWWQDGSSLVTLLYVGYCGCKGLFGLWLIRGCHELAGSPAPRWLGRAGPLLVAAFAALPLAVPKMVDLLPWQAPLMFATAWASLRALRHFDHGDTGVRLVRASLVALFAVWVIHPLAILGHERFAAARFVLAMNSLLDLAVQLMLGVGLLVGVLQEAHRRVLAAEQERERLQRSIDRDEKLRALGTLVSGVAHELNNPLAVILGSCELGDDGPDPATVLPIVAEQAARCHAIVRSLSALAGQSVHPREPLRAAELVARVVRSIAPAHFSGGRRVDSGAMAGVLLVADRIGLEQVLTNLVINALQASPPCGTVWIDATAARDTVAFTVVDQGPGVAPELRERLFEPFFTTKGPGEGTGLGLAIARSIVRAHRGTIEVEAREQGMGALFRVVLPRGEVAAAPPAPEPEVEGRRLLLVDDDAGVRAVVRRQAERRGWSVEEAASAEAALALGTTAAGGLERFDALLCDLRMPGMGGAGFADVLAREAPAVLARTCFITGAPGQDDADAFAARFARPLFCKPLDFEQLFAAIGRRAPIATGAPK